MSGPSQTLDHTTMARLAKLVEQAAGGKPIGCSAIDELAAQHGVPASHLYASAAAMTSVEIAREYKVAFVVCAGGCQSRGALECLDHLAEARRPRLKKWFKKAFDIQARGCLNACDFAPAIRVDSRDGTAYIQRATTEDLDEAIKAFCG